MEGGETGGGGGGLCFDIKMGSCSFETVLNFRTKTSIIFTSSSLPFPLSCSDLALNGKTHLNKTKRNKEVVLQFLKFLVYYTQMRF